MNLFTTIWYQQHWLSIPLKPLSWLYRFIIKIRKSTYDLGIKKTTRCPVPVIVVGNVTVGGTGKTPLVAWLAKWLIAQGYHPGLVSRGYKGKAKQWPQLVTPNSHPDIVGDEPLMLAQETQCPVAVAPNRVAAVQLLLAQNQCNIIISDDGLTHHALARDIEIVVIDGQRRFGNGHCLPAGPLREPLTRLQTVDFIMNNGGACQANELVMQLKLQRIYNLHDPNQMFSPNSTKIYHAIAGIGHPERFFATLTQLGIHFIPHVFPDHHSFTPTDIDFGPDTTVIMTAKDAVKCQHFADARHWCLNVYAEVSQTFINALQKKLTELHLQQKTAP